MTIEVFNENAFGLKTLLGQFSGMLKENVNEFNLDLKLQFNLEYNLSGKRNVLQGIASMHATLLHFDPNYTNKQHPPKSPRPTLLFWGNGDTAASVTGTTGISPRAANNVIKPNSQTTDNNDVADHSPPVHIFRLDLKHISVHDLVDTGTDFDKQDPMVQITVGKIIKRTERFVIFMNISLAD